MALETQILQRLNAINTLLNTMQADAKRTEDFPELIDIHSDSKIRVSYNTDSYCTTIGSILQVMGDVFFSEKFSIEATDGQIIFNVNAIADNIDVWIGSDYQVEGVDYTRVAGIVTMTNPVTLGDIFTYRTFSSDSTKEPFVATEGQTVFELSNNTRNVDVFVNGLYQIEIRDYTKSENFITFEYGLTAGDNVTVRKYR